MNMRNRMVVGALAICAVASDALAAGCENRDFDDDNDVDMTDFGVFQRCYSGANNPADPDCGH